MIVLIHVLALSSIGLLLYVTYGAWFKRFGEKYYDMEKRLAPWLVILPKWAHAVAYRVIMTLSLLALIYVYIRIIPKLH